MNNEKVGFGYLKFFKPYKAGKVHTNSHGYTTILFMSSETIASFPQDWHRSRNYASSSTPSSKGLSTAASDTLVSGSAERIVFDFPKENLIEKVVSSPVNYSKFLKSSRGWFAASTGCNLILDQPLPLSYRDAGTLLQSSVEGLWVTVVFSNGNHARCGLRIKNLCGKIPGFWGDASESFTLLVSNRLPPSDSLAEIFEVHQISMELAQ